MSSFKEMDPTAALKAIEGYEDVLTPAANELEDLYKTFKCPRCKGELAKEFDARHTFDGQSVVGRALLRCPTCRFLIDPHSNIVVETGNPAKIPLDRIPIIDPNKS